MKNTYNSTCRLWTEIVLSGGLVEDLGADETLSEAQQSVLNGIKAFGVSNSYIRRWHALYVVDCVKKVMCQRWPGAAD